MSAPIGGSVDAAVTVVEGDIKGAVGRSIEESMRTLAVGLLLPVVSGAMDGD